MKRISDIDKKQFSELHNSLRYSMLLCRSMGLFPVSGFMDPTINKLRYTWKSLYSIYYLMSLFGQFVMCGLAVHNFIVTELSLARTANTLFNGISFVSTILLWQLAREWPNMIYEVTSIEHILPPHFNRKLSRSCNVIAFVMMNLALVEHLLSVVFSVRFVMSCAMKGELSESYFRYAIPAVFDYTTFAVWKAFFAEVATVQATFLWTYVDVLIMLFSFYIKAYFDELNKFIKNSKKKVSTSWDDIRQQYSNMVRIVKLIDSRLNGIILVSFFTNLFYICLQLFNTLNQGYTGNYSCDQQDLDRALRGVEHTVYYAFSFVFLVVRAFMVSLMAANVHSAAHAPIVALCDVPAPSYSLEVQRFHRQVSYTTVALSGLNFFYVTRKMILKVVGTIVTYELVLFQFNNGRNIAPIRINLDGSNGTAIDDFE